MDRKFNQVNFMQIPRYIQSFILAGISQGTSFSNFTGYATPTQFDHRVKLDLKLYYLFKRTLNQSLN